MKRRLKKFFNFFLKYSYPALYRIEAGDTHLESVQSNHHNSTISNKAKVHGPSRLNNVTVGDYTYIAMNAVILSTRIGKFCSIGPNLFCGWGTHPINGLSTSPVFYSLGMQAGKTFSKENKIPEQLPIEIGNDVLIGMNVTILDGVKIGDGAVIGAGAIVSKNIPPYAIAVGSPIQVIKYRFDAETIEKLLKIKWWDFNEEDLKDVEKSFFNTEEFIAKHLKE